MTTKKPPIRRSPWMPAEYELEDVAAIQALMRGDAQPHQQRRALDFIIDKLCRTYDLSFRPESARDSDFAEGGRFVGLQLVKLTKLSLTALGAKPTARD